MVDICCSETAKLDMKFNASKFQAIRIGKSHRTDICHITLNGCSICFVDELKYLGWYVVSDRLLNVLRLACIKCGSSFFSHLTRFRLKVRTLLSLLFSILLMLNVSHICYMDLK